MAPYAHIGLGKCATTMLQKHIFPQIADRLGLEYMDLNDPRVRQLRAKVNTGLSHPQPEVFGTSFLSCEGLLGWDPFDWPRRIEQLTKHLPRNTKIIVTLRDPRAYFYSAYVQRTLHSGNVVAPEHFFLTSSTYCPEFTHPKFSVDDYDIAMLIKRLCTAFPDVEILKFEDILAGRVLGSQFSLPKVENKSLGTFSYNTIGALQKGLGYIGLSLISGETLRSQNDLAELTGTRAIKARYPLRRLLAYLDRSGKIDAVNTVLKDHADILARETAVYAGLASGGASHEPVSP